MSVLINQPTWAVERAAEITLVAMNHQLPPSAIMERVISLLLLTHMEGKAEAMTEAVKIVVPAERAAA